MLDELTSPGALRTAGVADLPRTVDGDPGDVLAGVVVLDNVNEGLDVEAISSKSVGLSAQSVQQYG